jgi:protoheme IX farnesyltransferase
MGWVACTQSFDFGGCLMALVLYSWQFPHFNALSWNLRADYSKAGYRMMSVLDPKFNAQVSLFHAMALFPISFGFYYTGMVDLSFLIDSSLLNGYFGWTAYEFWKSSNASTARRLFFASLLQLPIYLLLLLLHKQYHNSKNKDT